MNKFINKSLLFSFCFSILSISMASALPYILTSGDTLEINVINKKEFNTKQTIAPDGSISLPNIGRMKAAGLSIDELQKKVDSNFNKVIKNADVVILVTPKPIYVVQHDVVKQTWEVKEAKSPEEAKALMGGQKSETQINPGDVVTVNIGKMPDFWEDNWYKVLSAVGVAAGVWNVLR